MSEILLSNVRFLALFRCLKESTQCLVWNHKSLEKSDAMFFTSKHFTMLVQKAMHLIWFPWVLFRQDSVQHISIVNSSIELFSMNIWNRFLPFLYSKLNKYSLFMSKTIPWRKVFFLPISTIYPLIPWLISVSKKKE